jgi:hypothetical protein
LAVICARLQERRSSKNGIPAHQIRRQPPRRASRLADDVERPVIAQPRPEPVDDD